MPRRARQSSGGFVYHVLNRGNCRMTLFDKPADFAAFITLLDDARARFDMRILGYCLMSNHWHLVLWPSRDGELSRFMQWLATTHVRRWREHRGRVGEGHLYQGRFKSFPIERDEHCLTVLRYVEANPLRAGMVERAQRWPWSSLSGEPGVRGVRVMIADWPVDRPRDWARLVNQAVDEATQQQIKASLARGRPFGSERWIKKTAARLGLQSTLRDPWRPRGKGKRRAAKGAGGDKTRKRKSTSQ